MGIQFHVKTYECKAQWSYGGFNEFRKKLASSIGLDLDEMQGFRKKHPLQADYIKIGWRPWDHIVSPLKYLLNAPDHEGSLSPDQCKQIYPILLQILDLWELSIQDPHDYEHGKYLADSMKYCSESSKKLYWS